MKILCVGGGSGGHVTPVAAIISEIRKLLPEAEIRFITDKRFLQHSKELMTPLGVSVSTVMAGKLRRYANLKWYDHFQHFFISYLPNVVDIFKIGIGVLESQLKIIIFRPDVIFIKGGYVGLPVGLAAAWLYPSIPIVLHDSDARPGLTNRVLSRYATRIATGMPVEYSNYDSKITEFVGIPISDNFSVISQSQKSELRLKYGIDDDQAVVLALGGSQGSKTINQAVLDIYPELKGRARFYLLTGEGHFSAIEQAVSDHPRKYLGLNLLPYAKADELSDLMKISDVVITRAGATTMAELAGLKRTAIIIPSPYLASDHQTKNAELYQKNSAAAIVGETELPDGKLLSVLEELIDSKSKRDELANNLARFHVKNSAERVSKIIIGVGESSVKKKK